MQHKTTGEFNPEVMKLFDQYVHGVIDRRAFLNGATSSSSSTNSEAAAATRPCSMVSSTLSAAGPNAFDPSKW